MDGIALSAVSQIYWKHSEVYYVFMFRCVLVVWILLLFRNNWDVAPFSWHNIPKQQQQPKHFTYIHNNNICSKSPVDFCHNTDRFLCVILKYSSSTNYQHIRRQMKTISLFPFQTLINLLSFGFSPHMCPQQTLFATDKWTRWKQNDLKLCNDINSNNWNSSN